MTEVVSVKFKSKGKVYYFAPGELKIKQGDNLVVETSKGLEYAECVNGNHLIDDSTVRLPLRPVVRISTESDDRRAEENRRKEGEAFEICRQKVEERGLEMKIVDVEYNFEGNKVIFFFTSDGRVDFRELVKDLAAILKTRIELRQIGVRDEARMLGGLGICGKPFCCAQFLDDFQPVSIKMAKTQGLSLNPTKISGTCGRLMCCLKYEQDAYEDLVKNVPKLDSFVDTPAGKGSVVDINLLKSTVRVRLEDQSDSNIRTFSADEVEVLGGKAKRAEYLALRAEGKIDPPRPERFRKPLAEATPQVTGTAESGDEKKVSEESAGDAPKRRNKSRRRKHPSKGVQGQAPRTNAAQEKPNDASGRAASQRVSESDGKPVQGSGAAQEQGEQKKRRRRRRYGKKPGGAPGQGNASGQDTHRSSDK